MDGSGFARPIWSQKAKNDARRHLQGEIIECFDSPKRAGKVLDLNKWFSHNFPFTGLLENPGRERDLANQEGEREAEWYPESCGQGEFEQRLQMNPTYGE